MKTNTLKVILFTFVLFFASKSIAQKPILTDEEIVSEKVT